MHNAAEVDVLQDQPGSKIPSSLFLVCVIPICLPDLGLIICWVKRFNRDVARPCGRVRGPLSGNIFLVSDLSALLHVVKLHEVTVQGV